MEIVALVALLIGLILILMGSGMLIAFCLAGVGIFAQRTPSR